MRGTVLIVEPEHELALELRDALLADGRAVRIVDTFEAAARALETRDAAVLVTAVRLAAFNGLHLVIRSRAVSPATRCIVMGLPGDRSRDMEALHVPFLEKPVTGADLVDAVTREIELAAFQPQRRWPRKPVSLPAVVADSRIDIVDLSYGGIRLRNSSMPISVGSRLTVDVPSFGVSVTAIARWTTPVAPEGISWCGAEIIDALAGSTDSWRGVVDALN